MHSALHNLSVLLAMMSITAYGYFIYDSANAARGRAANTAKKSRVYISRELDHLR